MYVCICVRVCVFSVTCMCVYMYVYIYICVCVCVFCKGKYAWNSLLLRECSVYPDGATALMCLKGAAVLAHRCACVRVCVLVLISAYMCVCIASVTMECGELIVAVKIHIHYLHTCIH